MKAGINTRDNKALRLVVYEPYALKGFVTYLILINSMEMLQKIYLNLDRKFTVNFANIGCRFFP